MYLVFDTETTGFAKRKTNKDPNDFSHFPHVIQLAFIRLDENFNEIETYNELIKPDNWEIPVEKFWIDHGYNTKESQRIGVPMPEALKHFCNAIDNSKILIAHNMKFDHPIIGAEMMRYKTKPENKNTEKICTMMSTIKFCNIPNKNRGGLKFPKLDELHVKLFGVSFDGAHDALEDVRATVRCFVELKKLKVL